MQFDCLDVKTIVGFDWDEGNIHKNEDKHGLKWIAIEEVFFNEPLLIVGDFKHSLKECRCVALGKNDFDDLVTVIFTIRENKIRVISARQMSKKERIIYTLKEYPVKELKKIPNFKSEAQESSFWDENDVTEYFDMSKAKPLRFANLKKTTKSISLRLPVDMIEELKVKANAMDVPYQSLIKIFLTNALKTA